MITVKNVASFMTMGASNAILNDTVMNGIGNAMPTFGGKTIDTIAGDAAVNLGKNMFAKAKGAYKKHKQEKKDKKNKKTLAGEVSLHGKVAFDLPEALIQEDE